MKFILFLIITFQIVLVNAGEIQLNVSPTNKGPDFIDKILTDAQVTLAKRMENLGCVINSIENFRQVETSSFDGSIVDIKTTSTLNGQILGSFSSCSTLKTVVGVISPGWTRWSDSSMEIFFISKEGAIEFETLTIFNASKKPKIDKSLTDKNPCHIMREELGPVAGLPSCG